MGTPYDWSPWRASYAPSQGSIEENVHFGRPVGWALDSGLSGSITVNDRLSGLTEKSP